MKIGDIVQVSNQYSKYYYYIGEIYDIYNGNIYVELDKNNLQVFSPEELIVYDILNQTFAPATIWEHSMSQSIKKQKCNHDWKSEKYFTSKVFTTCAKCGLHKEDETNDDDFGIPF